MSTRQPLHFYNAIELFLDIPQIANHMLDIHHLDRKMHQQIANNHHFIPQNYSQLFQNNLTNQQQTPAFNYHKQYRRVASNKKIKQNQQKFDYCFQPQQFIPIPTLNPMNPFFFPDMQQVQMQQISPSQKRLQKQFQINEKPIDFLLIVDFECTCDSQTQIQNQEIIEFPILVFDTQSLQIIDTFHSYVKPTINPILTPFCTQLTGITQQQVDSSNTIEYVLKAAQNFLQKFQNSNVCMINDCKSDIDFLQRECKLKGIKPDQIFNKYIDLKEIYPEGKVNNLDSMLKDLDMEFAGIKHRGIDDAKNLARVIGELSRRGYVYGDHIIEQWKDVTFMASLCIHWGANGIKEVGIIGLKQDQQNIDILWNWICDKKIEDGDKKQKLQQAIQAIEEFVNRIGTSYLENFQFVTFGNQSLKRIKTECQKNKIEIPHFLQKSLNLRKFICKKQQKNMNSQKIQIETKQTEELNNKNNQQLSVLQSSFSVAQMAQKLFKNKLFREQQIQIN